MKNTKTPSQKFTPKGLTQNWEFIQQYDRKMVKGGPFESRLEAARNKIKISVKRERAMILESTPYQDDINFSVKATDKEVKVYPKNKGKFAGKVQTYSPSLAAKLGII